MSELRAKIAREPNNPDLHLQLATTLHALDQLHPNGGKRIPEAEKAYRYNLRSCSAACIVCIDQPSSYASMCI